ncbi:MAG: hypothetical protein H7256_02535 [Bdellovibrio sp.]|nr:hypothetical protein [Bdellovibrio sp.]
MKKMLQNMKVFLLLAVFVSVGATSLKANAEVWPTENQWSAEWEQKYHDWLKTSTDAHLFSRQTNSDGTPNPYYGIRVDCADLVYSLRIIFSYENKLPWAMHNPASPRGALISNSISRYDKSLAGIKRLKTFLTWVYDLVSTHGLPDDTYSPPFEAVGPGTIILTSKKNHHSWTIRDITRAGNPDLLFNSTVGRTSGFDVQERLSWPNPSWIFEAEVDKDDETKNVNVYKPGSYPGFRYWRPLDAMTVPESAVPGYSDEQFTVGISKWKGIAQSKLAKVKETYDQIVMRLLNDACSDFQQRISAVAEVEFLKGAWKEQAEQTADGTLPVCLSAENFDQYSTPSRDKRFVDGLVMARVYFQKGMKEQGAGAFTDANLTIYKTIFPLISRSAAEEAALDKSAKSENNFCSLEISKEMGKLSLAELKRRAFAGWVSANPNDSVSGRFGYPKTSKDIGYSACKDQTYGLGRSGYNLNAIEKDAKAEISQ